jgi:hypothetical protein
LVTVQVGPGIVKQKVTKCLSWSWIFDEKPGIVDV